MREMLSSIAMISQQDDASSSKLNRPTSSGKKIEGRERMLLAAQKLNTTNQLSHLDKHGGEKKDVSQVYGRHLAAFPTRCFKTITRDTCAGTAHIIRPLSSCNIGEALHTTRQTGLLRHCDWRTANSSLWKRNLVRL